MLRGPPIVRGGGTSAAVGGLVGGTTKKQPAPPLACARAHLSSAFVAPEVERASQSPKALPRPGPPLMLLTGDEFHVGSDGICRTLYRLRENENEDVPGDDDGGDDGRYMVEELFHLERARKTFVLRGPPPPSSEAILAEDSERRRRGGGAAAGLALGPRLFELDLREIDGGAGGPAGTGAATWEASIGMALHFARRPDLLCGGGGRDGGGGPRDVVELGSGVGAGGILTKVATDIAAAAGTGRRESEPSPGGAGPIGSITLTDVSPDVLERARENVRRAGPDGLDGVEVRALDWNDFDPADVVGHRRGVDVIASDCVYSLPQLVPLADAITTLLGPPDGCGGSGGGSSGTAHLFGPCDRAPLGEMVAELGDVRRGLDVVVDTIEMERYRLRPPPPSSTSSTHPRPDPLATSAATGAASGRVGGGGGGGAERRDDDDDLATRFGAEGGQVIASRSIAKLVYIRASRREGGSPAGLQTNEGGLCGID